MGDPVSAWIAKKAAEWAVRKAARGFLSRWRRLDPGLRQFLLVWVLVGSLIAAPVGWCVLGMGWFFFALQQQVGAFAPGLPAAGAQGQRAIAPAVQAWAPLAGQIAAEHGLDPALVLAVIQAESGGDPLAVSPAGALGLMQVMPDKFSPHEDPFDPETNLRAGCAYLRKMLDRYGGDLELALAAYNSGPGAVDRWGGVPPFPETVGYIERVLLLYAETSDDPDRPVRAAEAQGAAGGGP
ncbi:MAG: lytic transglycosylase domain-containing protein [Bacillota bacterium]